MIEAWRVMLCDGLDCPAASLDIFYAIEAEVPDWHGWREFPVEGKLTKHLCPTCVAAGVPVSDQHE